MGMVKTLPLREDFWLSDILDKPCYQIRVDAHDLSDFVLPEELQKNSFAFAKIPVDDLKSCQHLQSCGFHLVDTQVLFEKMVSSSSLFCEGVRWTRVEDKKAVREVACNSFRYSRFHADAVVSVLQANRIKKEWAGNYYEGRRGDHMAVAEQEGEIQGFLQLIDTKGDLLIDLIAVSQKFRSQGVAKSLIAFVQNELPNKKKIKVGTQLANTPSIRLYETMGFTLHSSYYVFHYHKDVE